MLEELLKYLGFDPTAVKTIDDFKKSFDPEFVRKSAAKDDKDVIAAVTGKRIGSLATKVRDIAKKNGIDLVKSEVEKKDVEEVVDFVFAEMGKTNLETVNKLKEDLAKTSDDKVKDLEGKLSKRENDYSQLDELHKKTTSDFNSFKETSATQMKEFKLGRMKSDEISKVKLKQGITPAEKLGYEAVVNGIKWDMAEDESVIIPLGADGKKIPSTKVTGAFKTAAEVLEEEAQRLGVLSQAPDKKTQVIPGAVVTNPIPGAQEPKRYPINDRAIVQ